jgi:hypothetical protein
MSIANAGHDERGKYSGGKAGDQTGSEWEVRSWYNRPWNFVARFDKAVGVDIAKLARNAANNNHIGYDQSQRISFWELLKNTKNYDPANITKNCESDCSAGVASIVKAVGYRKDLTKLKNVPVSMWTGNERETLRKAGATILTDSKYLSSDAYLLPGDILCNEAHHTCINLTTGSKVKTSTGTPSGTKYYVKAKALNVRNMPSTAKSGTKVVGILHKNDVVYLTNIKTNSYGNTWGKISYGTYKGSYIAIKYNDEVFAKKA